MYGVNHLSQYKDPLINIHLWHDVLAVLLVIRLQVSVSGDELCVVGVAEVTPSSCNGLRWDVK